MPRTLCTRPRSRTVWYCDDGASSFLTCVQTFPERAWDWMRGASPYLCARWSGPPCWASSRAATSAAFLALSAAFSASFAACVSGDGRWGDVGCQRRGSGCSCESAEMGRCRNFFVSVARTSAAGGRAGACTAVRRSCESGNTAHRYSATSRGVTRGDRRVARRPRGRGSRADSAGDDQGLEIHRSRSYLLGTLLGLALGAALGGGLGGHRGRGVLGDGRGLNLGRRGFGHLLSLVAYRARRCGSL